MTDKESIILSQSSFSFAILRAFAPLRLCVMVVQNPENHRNESGGGEIDTLPARNVGMNGVKFCGECVTHSQNNKSPF